MLLSEGESDKIMLSALLPSLSPKLKSAMSDSTLVIEPMQGARNLSHRLSALQATLCKTHIFLDNDKPASDAFDKAVQEGLSGRAGANFATVQGLQHSELEDCLDEGVYSASLLKHYGVTIPDNFFKGKAKWADRLQAAFKAQGRMWSDNIKSEVKMHVARAVSSAPNGALSQHRRAAVDSLVYALEQQLFEKA